MKPKRRRDKVHFFSAALVAAFASAPAVASAQICNLPSGSTCTDQAYTRGNCAVGLYCGVNGRCISLVGISQLCGGGPLAQGNCPDGYLCDAPEKGACQPINKKTLTLRVVGTATTPTTGTIKLVPRNTDCATTAGLCQSVQSLVGTESGAEAATIFTTDLNTDCVAKRAGLLTASAANGNITMVGSFANQPVDNASFDACVQPSATGAWVKVAGDRTTMCPLPQIANMAGGLVVSMALKTKSPPSVPSLPPWAIVLLSAALGGLGFSVLRHRRHVIH